MSVAAIGDPRWLYNMVCFSLLPSFLMLKKTPVNQQASCCGCQPASNKNNKRSHPHRGLMLTYRWEAAQWRARPRWSEAGPPENGSHTSSRLGAASGSLVKDPDYLFIFFILFYLFLDLEPAIKKHCLSRFGAVCALDC
jgi:hypothetical protein